MELNQFFVNIGLLIIRFGLGVTFIRSGFGKLMTKKEKLIDLGNAMQNIGITTYPLFWGISAMLSELIGGTCILIGLYTRFFALILCFTMFIATLHHFYARDTWQVILYPLSYFFICLGLFFAGPGAYRITALFH